MGIRQINCCLNLKSENCQKHILPCHRFRHFLGLNLKPAATTTLLSHERVRTVLIREKQTRNEFNKELTFECEQQPDETREDRYV